MGVRQQRQPLVGIPVGACAVPEPECGGGTGGNRCRRLTAQRHRRPKAAPAPSPPLAGCGYREYHPTPASTHICGYREYHPEYSH